MNVTVKYCGMAGAGKNVTAAKQDAARKLEAALAGDYTPEILAWRGYAILIYGEPSGWHSLTLAGPETGIREGKVYGCCYGERFEAVDAARRHLAQLGYRPGDGDTPPQFLTDRRAIGEFKSWVRFQERYQVARAAGLDDNQCHAYGCGSLCDPAILARVDGPKEESP